MSKGTEVSPEWTAVEEIFSYAPLQSCERDECIRVLRLDAAQSIGSPLHGQLQSYQLHSEEIGPFEALSYTWASITTSQDISLEGKMFNIRQNLSEALRALRFPDRPRLLWIDAICINQDNSAEKTNQVALMGQIYAHARRVIVWLGEGSSCENDFKAYQLFRWASPLTTLHPWRKGGGPWQLPSLSTVLQCFNELKISNPFNTTYVTLDVTLNDIQQFLTRPWFSRRWIVQEICNAREITVRFGCYQLDWINFSAALDTLTCAPEDSRCLEHHPVNRLLIWKRGVITDSVLKDMEAFSDFEGSDDRDRVASLLKLRWPHIAPGSDFVVSYSQSVEENYYRLAVHMVEIGKGANVLIAAANSHRDAGENGLAQSSWVPDWRTMRQRKISSILMEEGFDVRIMQGNLLRFFGRIRGVYKSNPTADVAGDAYVTRHSQLLRLPKKGDILCSLTTKKGNQDPNCVVLRPSNKSEHYSLNSGTLEHYHSMDDISLVDGPTQIREFLVD